MSKTLTRSLTALLLASLLAAPASALRNPSLRQQGDLPRDQFVDLVDPGRVHLDKLVVQFVEDTRIRLRDGRLVSLEGRDLSAVEGFLKKHPEIRLRRVFESMGEEELDAYVARGERLSGWDVADLNNFYLFEIAGGARDAKGLLTELLKLELVQTGYYEPIAVPAVCGSDPAPATPLNVAGQDYREAAPTGVDIDYAWSFDPVNARGIGSYWFQDLEWGWTENHEDFSSLSIVNGADSGSWDAYSHGTAVVSIVGACEDGKGVTGLTPGVHLTARVVSNHSSTADALIAIGGQLLTGETYLIEMHAGGPSQGTACTCNCGQFEYIAMEYWTANFNAILANTANGKTCIEAAGNGSMDLDWAGYGGAFNLGVRDSGAIVVGAGTSGSVHNPECWTNHGSRISAMGWGDGVYAAAYGDLFNPAGDDQDYTASFSGTSSASPIVAGSAISLALIHRAQAGSYLSPVDLRSRLQINGTAQGPTDTWKEIAKLPNLKGVLAPDLEPINPGWADMIVPSDVAGTTVLPAALQPSPATTYVDWSWKNNSFYGAAGAFQNYLLVDDEMRAFNNMTGGNPANFYYWTSDIAIPVRGGLHYLRLTTDVHNNVVESLEGNNSKVIGYRWNPVPLTSGAPQTFSRGPLKSPQGYSSYAQDGYTVAGTPGWWDVTAVMPNGAADYDIYLYNTAPTPTSGFTSTVATSGSVSFTDLVGHNRNGGTQANISGVINYSNAAVDYTVEREASQYMGGVPSIQSLLYANALDAGEILDVLEINVLNLNPIRFALDVTDGNADVAILVFGPSTTSFGRGQAQWTLNSAGDGGDEIGSFTPTSTGYHGVVIVKNAAAQLAEHANYNLYWGPPSGDLTHSLPSGWSSQVVPRNEGVGTLGQLPATLAEGLTRGDFGMANVGSGAVPAGWNERFHLDGPVISTSSDYAGLPVGYSGHMPAVTIGSVKGGRHEIGHTFDCNSEVAEELPGGELNNSFFTQYAWTGHPLASMAPETRSAAPNWINNENPAAYSQPGFNQDGYQAGLTYWSGVAVMPTSTEENLAAYIYTGADNGTTTGFLNPVWGDYSGPGGISFVAGNGNVMGNGFQLNVGVTEIYSYPEGTTSQPYVVQAATWGGDLNPGIVAHNTLAETAGGSQLLHMYDAHLTAGESYPVTLFNNSGVDLGVAIFNAGESLTARQFAAAVLNNPGAGVDESGVFTPTTTGWHGVAVYRNSAADLGSAADYGLVLGDWQPGGLVDLDIHMTDIDGTDSYLGFWLDWTDVAVDSHGNPLAVDHYNCYYALSSSGPWMLFDTPVASQSGVWTAYAPDGNLTIVFRVTAVDEDGTLLATSGPMGGIAEPDGRVVLRRAEAPATR